jgi:predicted TIM-barrel fold metal-dependent hydrolase
MKIDAHHHLWRYDPVLARDFTAQDLVAAMTSPGIDAAIAVQARQTKQETADLLAYAASPVVAQAGAMIFETMLATASGRPTRSEALGVGDFELVPRQMGA